MTENAPRGTDHPEFELLDTGVFAGNRYFDVFVEYAQAEPGDILMQSPPGTAAPTPRRCTCCRSWCCATPGPGVPEP